MVHVTRGLLDGLCKMAAEAEPDSISVALSVTPASELSGEKPNDDTPVFTHFYMPDAARSVSAVFGVDLSTPLGQTRGRFISHPNGDRSVSLADDLHGIIFVAIPPWEAQSVVCYDRAGRSLPISVLDAVPPGETLDDH